MEHWEVEVMLHGQAEKVQLNEGKSMSQDNFQIIVRNLPVSSPNGTPRPLPLPAGIPLPRGPPLTPLNGALGTPARTPGNGGPLISIPPPIS